MKYIIDLTGKRFNSVYFDQSYVAFKVPERLDLSLSILIWGILVPNPEPSLISKIRKNLRGGSPCPVYLSGWGLLTFHGVTSGAAELEVYEPTFDLEKSRFLKREDESVYTLNKDWASTNAKSDYEYCMTCFLEYPEGFLSLDICAEGKVQLCVNPLDFVTSEMVIQHPEKYSYDRYRERQLATIIDKS